jgi:hypothetical protein
MHNVAKEFSADDIFEKKASIAHKMAKRMKKDALGGATENEKDASKIELVVPVPKETTVGETETKKDADGEWAV